MLRHEPILQSSALRDHYYFAILAALALLLTLGGRPLICPDEGRYVEIAREMWLSGDYITPRLNGMLFFDKPILLYWCQVLSYKIFGLHEWSMRLPSALSAWLCLVYLFHVVCGVYGRRTAWCSASLLLFSPLFFGASRYVNMDMMAASFISISLLSLWSHLIKPSARTLTLAYIAAALATLTKGLIGMLFPGMIVLLWLICHRQLRDVKQVWQWRGLLLFALLVIPWFVLVQLRHSSFFDYFIVYQHATRFLETGFNNALPWWFYGPVFLLALIPWACFIPQMFYQLRATVSEKETFMLMWCGFVLLFFSIPTSKIIGYILPALPPMAILLGRYIDKVWWQRLAGALHIGVGLATVILFLQALSMVYFFNLTMPSHLSLWYTVMLGCLVGLVLLLPFIMYRQTKRYGMKAFFIHASLGIWLILLLMHLMSPDVLYSGKDIGLALKERVRADDTVAFYTGYFYDVPVYSGHIPVVVDNWDPKSNIHDNYRHHFIWASQQENASDYLWTADTWLQAWIQKSLYTVVAKYNQEKFEALLQQHELPFSLELAGKSLLLYSNKTKKPPKPG